MEYTIILDATMNHLFFILTPPPCYSTYHLAYNRVS